jgi:hypothetical protein
VIGLLPTFEAIKAGKQIALASKEVLVAAGEIVMPLCHKHGVTMTPIDSEHSAIFQCLQGYRPDQVSELILTASGGPFRGRTREELQNITVEQALNHPTWNMGGKITIDSATLMNKGLEMIEAKWLFGVGIDQVKVCVHPQSIIHSMVKFTDGSVLGQLGWPNMRLPIAYALLYPERPANDLKNWDPTDSPQLTFEKPDEDTFRSLALAREFGVNDVLKEATCACTGGLFADSLPLILASLVIRFLCFALRKPESSSRYDGRARTFTTKDRIAVAELHPARIDPIGFTILNDFKFDQELADVAPVGSCVADQGSANGTWNSHRKLQAHQTSLCRFQPQILESDSRIGNNNITVNLDCPRLIN